MIEYYYLYLWFLKIQTIHFELRQKIQLLEYNENDDYKFYTLNKNIMNELDYSELEFEMEEF